MKMENRDLLAPKIIKVLNTRYQEFSLDEVLDIIPLHWSLSMLNNFLSRSLRNSIHNEQQTKIIKNIVQGENTNVINYNYTQFYISYLLTVFLYILLLGQICVI